MQLVSARIWTRVTVSISYEDNHYTKTFTSKKMSIMNKNCWHFLFKPKKTQLLKWIEKHSIYPSESVHIYLSHAIQINSFIYQSIYLDIFISIF